MPVGVFVPVNNDGWLISEAAPRYRPTFELDAAITRKAEKHGLSFPALDDGPDELSGRDQARGGRRPMSRRQPGDDAAGASCDRARRLVNANFTRQLHV